MSLKDLFFKQAEKTLKAIPGVSQKIEKEYDGMMDGLEKSVKPYKGKFPVFTQIPPAGQRPRRYFAGHASHA